MGFGGVMFHRRLSILSFRMRSPLRDAETDRSRSERLIRFINEIAAEVTAERSGLAVRYREACISAGFASDAAGTTVSVEREERLAELSATIIACERRLTTLGHHLQLLAEAKADIGQMMPEIARTGPTSISGD